MITSLSILIQFSPSSFSFHAKFIASAVPMFSSLVIKVILSLTFIDFKNCLVAIQLPLSITNILCFDETVLNKPSKVRFVSSVLFQKRI